MPSPPSPPSPPPSGPAATLHRAINDLTVAVAYLQHAAEDIRLVDGDTGVSTFRLLVLAERAMDHERAVRRLIDDLRKAAPRPPVPLSETDG